MTATLNPARPALARRLGRGRIAPAIALAATGVAGTMIGPLARTPINDLHLYRFYGEQLAAGMAPYRDLPLEYPPLALPIFWLPGLFGEGMQAYEIAFGVLALIAMLVVQQCVFGLGGPRGPLAAWLVVPAPLVVGALMRTRFDVIPLAVTVAALLALARDRPRTGFVLLGLGGLAKLFPLALVPVAAAWLAGRGRRREAALGVAIAAAVFVAVSLPFLSAGYLDSFRYHLDRPVQIESLPATLLLASGDPVITGTRSNPDRFRSQGVEAPADAVVAGAFGVLALACLALACLLAWAGRSPPGDAAASRLVLASLLALLAIIAFGKVLSPQFLIWLVPFAALAWAWGARAEATLIAAALVLTSVEFPSRYFDLVAGDPGVIALVGARNALLVAAVATLAVRLVRRSALLR